VPEAKRIEYERGRRTSLYFYALTPCYIWFTDAAPGTELFQYVCGHRRRLWGEEKDVRAINFVVIDLHPLRSAGSMVCLLEVVHQPSGSEFRHIARRDQYTVPGWTLR